MTILRASALIGLPVVAIDRGDDVAEVRDVVCDGRRHAVIGFTLNKRGWFRGRLKKVLPADAVAGLGAAAVMVEREADLLEPDEVPNALSDAPADHEVLGAAVLTQSGKQLGTVVDVLVRTGGSLRTVGYELAVADGAPTRLLRADDATAASADTFVVPDGTATFEREDWAGFGDSAGARAESEHRS